jgi:excisionase family DNA binding protein
MPTMNDRFLTLSEVRSRLKVSRATLWRWINEKGLTAFRVGHVTRIRESDLQKFLSSHEIVSESASAAGGDDTECPLP